MKLYIYQMIAVLAMVGTPQAAPESFTVMVADGSEERSNQDPRDARPQPDVDLLLHQSGDPSRTRHQSLGRAEDHSLVVSDSHTDRHRRQFLPCTSIDQRAGFLYTEQAIRQLPMCRRDRRDNSMALVDEAPLPWLHDRRQFNIRLWCCVQEGRGGCYTCLYVSTS